MSESTWTKDGDHIEIILQKDKNIDYKKWWENVVDGGKKVDVGAIEGVSSS